MFSTTVTPTERSIAAAVRAGVPPLIWGDPGVGKTASITSMAESWGRHLEVLIGSIREATDFLGLPIEVDGAVEYSPLGWAKRLNAAPSSMALFDELTTAGPAPLKAMLRVLQERTVADLKLGDHVALIAAANPPEIAVDGYDLPAPIANRFLHLDWSFNAGAWLSGIASNFEKVAYPSIDAMIGAQSANAKAKATSHVATFLKTNPAHLNPKVPTDPIQAGRAWASPRSWHNAVRVLSELDPVDDEARYLVVKGLVGDGPAAEFFSWLAANDLFDPAEVLNDPTIVDWKAERVDRLFALATGLTSLGTSDPTLWAKAVDALTYAADAGRPDVMMPAMRTLANAMPKGAKIPATTKGAFADIFTAMGRYAAEPVAA